MFPAEPGHPELAPLLPGPPYPVSLGSCRGDRVRLANDDLADVIHVSPCGVTLRPLTRIERTVYDSRADREVTFTVRTRSYTVAASAMCQAVVEHNPPKGEE